MRCRNCTHFHELPAPGTGTCCHPESGAEYPAKKVTTSASSCERFTSKHPAKRRRIATATPSADAVHIAEAIDRLASAVLGSLTDPRHGSTLYEAASGIEARIEDAADRLADR